MTGIRTALLVLTVAIPGAAHAQFSDVPGNLIIEQPKQVAPLPAAEPRRSAAPAATPASPRTASVGGPDPAPTATAPPKAATPGEPAAPAKQLFGAAKAPAPLSARAIGSYARGCLAGAEPLSIDGPAWQAMRLSRNRNWGHPRLIALVERLAGDAKAHDGWPGLLVGDLSQPRGGPMLTGHASHQIGLDADIWLTPMPSRRLSEKEREELSATSMLGPDQLSVDPKVWTPAHLALIRRAASYAEVERVLVHPGIKQALCKGAGTSSRGWLAKVRPYWGHHYHMHIRIGCPPGSTECAAQAPIPGDDGCGKELDDWFKLLTAPPKAPEGPPKPPMTLDQLPAACRVVLQAPADANTTGGGKSAPAKAARPGG